MQTVSPARKAAIEPSSFEVEGRASLLTLSEEERRFRSVWHLSTLRAFANLLKTMVGAGVLTLPQATMQFGILASLVGVVLAGYLSAIAIILAIECNARVADTLGERPRGADVARQAEDIEEGTWQRIARAACGRLGVALVTSAILVAQLGVCAAYFDFIVMTLVDHMGLSHPRAIATTWVLMTLVSMPRQLKSVAVLSMVGLLTYTYVLLLLGHFASEALDCGAMANTTFTQIECALVSEKIRGTAPICHIGIRPQPVLMRLEGFGAWFGPTIFAFEGMGTALGIYDAVVASTQDRAPFGTSSSDVRRAADASFCVVVYSAYFCGVVLYISVGTIGYLAWGELVPGAIIDAFPHGVARDSGESVLAAVLGLTFALQMNPVWALLEPMLLRKDPCKMAWPLLRAGVVGLICVGCWLVPEVDGMVAISGSIGFSLLGFILPGLFYLRISALSTSKIINHTSDGQASAAKRRWWHSVNAIAFCHPQGRGRDALLGAPTTWRVTVKRAVSVVLLAVGLTGSILGVAAIFADSSKPFVFPEC